MGTQDLADPAFGITLDQGQQFVIAHVHCNSATVDRDTMGANHSPATSRLLTERGYTERRFRRRDRRRFSAWVEVDAWARVGPGAGRGLRPTFRDLRLRRVGEPRKRSEREHATLSLGRAATELAEPYAHVASQNVCAGAGLDDDHLMPIRMPGRRQQADSR